MSRWKAEEIHLIRNPLSYSSKIQMNGKTTTSTRAENATMAQQTVRTRTPANQEGMKSPGRWNRDTHSRHRDYSPTLGRFIERDPIGFEAGDNNWYRFVANGPTDAVDPTGTVEEKPDDRRLFPRLLPEKFRERCRQIIEERRFINRAKEFLEELKADPKNFVPTRNEQDAFNKAETKEERDNAAKDIARGIASRLFEKFAKLVAREPSNVEIVFEGPFSPQPPGQGGRKNDPAECGVLRKIVGHLTIEWSGKPLGDGKSQEQLIIGLEFLRQK